MSREQVSSFLNAISEAAERKEPVKGEPFTSSALDQLVKDEPELLKVRDFAAKFTYSHRKGGNLIFMKPENNHDSFVVSYGISDGSVGIEFYKLLDGIEREPIFREELVCHLTCMIVDFFERALAHYEAMQSITSDTKPNPNSPWYDG